MLIEAKNLHRRYVLKRHELDVLRGADLSVDTGETVAVVGRSGAGKSTLLHILGGIDRPDEGSGNVLIDGEDLYRASSSRRTQIRATRIGFVFQSYHLLNEMDVLENVMLPARGIGINTASMRERSMELLDAVGVADRAHHTPLELSGGEQQRVALARALINDPSIVLADEPTGNLDGETGGVVLEMLFALTKERGHALVMVTHNQQIADTCDRSLLLDEGQLKG
ncbi:MAG: ABC transporter ATP-binding protein [Verrucomicrobia bacterium]|jgi:predicted ABC-type transport system involved in lysophospholipase L1 biosynthesis ATPase subunit|nr:ABC transporter ATP-binding protein [Verrucomicrobiota bacterium]